MHTFTTEDALQSLRAKARQDCLPSLITISGGTHSGKTHLCRRLSSFLEPLAITVTTLALDDYFRDIDDPQLPRNGNGRIIFDHPESYHRDEFVAHATDLVAGRAVDAPIYNKAVNLRVKDETRRLTPATVVLAEGLFAGTFLAHHPSAFHIFVDTPRTTCMMRRMISDSKLYGVTQKKVEDYFLHHILPYWDEYITPQKKLADILLKD